MSTLPFKLFGCVVYVFVQGNMRTKLDRRTHKCIFLGYASSQKGYKCYCPITRKMIVSLDVLFDEAAAYYTNTQNAGEQTHIMEPCWSIIDVETSGCGNTLSNNAVHPQTTTRTGLEDSEPSSSCDRTEPQQLPIVRVYTRRHNITQGLESIPKDLPSSSSDDLPIALRKGVRECTKHPLYNFLAYDKLSRTFRAFTCSLDSQDIPTNIQDALTNPL